LESFPSSNVRNSRSFRAGIFLLLSCEKSGNEVKRSGRETPAKKQGRKNKVDRRLPGRPLFPNNT